MVIRTAKGKVTTIDGREKAPARDAARLVHGERRRRSRSTTRASAGSPPACPARRATWERALKQVRHDVARAGAAARHPRGHATASRSTRRSSTRSTRSSDYFDDVPSTAALYLDPDGTPRDVGTTQRNPDMAKTYRIIGRQGARKGFYHGAVAKAMADAAPRPADRRRRRPHVAQGPDDDRRPRALHGARARADRVLPRPDVYGMGPPSSGGTTVARCSTSSAATRFAGASRARGAAPLPRGLALHVRRPQRLPRRPGVLQGAGQGPALDSFADERRALITDTAAKSPVAAGDRTTTRATPRRPGRARPRSRTRQSTTHLTVADPKGNAVSYTFTIESTGGNGIVVPGYGFLLNNELTDFNFDSRRTRTARRAASARAARWRRRSSRRRQAVHRHRLAGRLDDPGTVLQTLVNRIDLKEPLPTRSRCRARSSATRRARRPSGVHRLAGGPGPASALGTSSSRPTTPRRSAPRRRSARRPRIEFRAGNQFIAAAEPQRRGTGSAGVVTPTE